MGATEWHNIEIFSMHRRDAMFTTFSQHLGLVGLIPFALLAQPPAKTTVPAIHPPPFATQIKKAVVFIETDCQAPSGIERHVGTGFLLFMPDSRLGKERGFAYLVTNRHVVQPGIEDSRPCQVISYSIRLNLKGDAKNPNPGSRLISIGDGKGFWFFPADDSVDLAVAGFAPNEGEFDFQMVPVSILASSEDSFAEGDPVLFTGLFIQYMRQTRMQPIVRAGSLAMVPDELLPTTLKKMGRVYLAEVHSFGANSGSPMFIDVAGIRKGNLKYDFKLLGVVAGEVFETANFQLQVATSYKGDVSANSGVSIVVPATELKTLLESPSLQTQRDAIVTAATLDNQGTKP